MIPRQGFLSSNRDWNVLRRGSPLYSHSIVCMGIISKDRIDTLDRALRLE